MGSGLVLIIREQSPRNIRFLFRVNFVGVEVSVGTKDRLY